MTRQRVRIAGAGAVVAMIGPSPLVVAAGAWIALELAAWPIVKRGHVAEGFRVIATAATCSS